LRAQGNANAKTSNDGDAHNHNAAKQHASALGNSHAERHGNGDAHAQRHADDNTDSNHDAEWGRGAVAGHACRHVHPTYGNAGSDPGNGAPAQRYPTPAADDDTALASC
jgi:hypothetical protein